MYRLCYQRPTFVSIYAEEQGFDKVPGLATCRLITIWIFYYGHDRSQHYNPNDEGR